MVGGVAAAAAVRTYPFRVFSFPKGIAWNSWEYYPAGTWPNLLTPLSLNGLPYFIGDEDHPITTGTFYGIRRNEVVHLAVAEVMQNNIRDMEMLVKYSDRAALLRPLHDDLSQHPAR